MIGNSTFRSPILVHFFSTFRDRCRRIGMRPTGWRVAFLQSPATVQVTLSTGKLRLSLSDVACFPVSWNETLFQNSMRFVPPKRVYSLLNVTLNALYAFLRLLYISLIDMS